MPAPAIQESNQTSPSATTEPTALVGQTQHANNNSVQTPKTENQAKGIRIETNQKNNNEILQPIDFDFFF